MTKKQMRKLAQEIADCELIHANEATSKEDKAQAEKRIMQLTNRVMALPNGISTMLEIDLIVQQILNKQGEM